MAAVVVSSPQAPDRAANREAAVCSLGRRRRLSCGVAQ